jgi:hypothetical protein
MTAGGQGRFELLQLLVGLVRQDCHRVGHLPFGRRSVPLNMALEPVDAPLPWSSSTPVPPAVPLALEGAP